MTGLRSRSLAALVLIVSLAACKKEGGGDADGLPAEMKPHPAQGDPSKLVMPAVMAYVPADTPYLIAGVDAVPPGLYEKAKQAFAPMAEMIGAQWKKLRVEGKMFDAVLSELDGKWNQAGLESLGLSAEPRFALYGLGLQPVVLRVAVKDHKRVQATIERIAAKAGEQLPPIATKDGRNYWRRANDDGSSLVVAFADNQLIFAGGKDADIDAKLDLILGIARPAHSMADGALIKELMARHGLGGQVIAFVDTKQVAAKAIEAAGGTVSPACSAEVDRLSATVPRVVFGYGEMSATKVSGGMVVELSPDAVSALRAIKTEIPGLGLALAGHPLIAMAGGVDLPKAQQLGIRAAASLEPLGVACGLRPLADSAGRAAHGLAKPVPEPFGQIAGGAAAVTELAWPAGHAYEGVPSKVDGIVLVASPDARALFTKAGELAPPIKSFGITADGKLHPVTAPMAMPFPVTAGVGDRLIVVSTGDKSHAVAEKLLGARGGKAPLFAISYDVGRFMDLAVQSGRLQSQAASDPQIVAFLGKLKDVFGYVSGTLDVTDHGLALWSTVELK